ncbi:pseudouridine synthase [Thermoflexus sp.]|uniref:pseudouridine synthase n=1 Tax=Thermoflexus sp. TaxID=1969742 RepID=UPI00176BB929|nr:pseudouridine synthase [Thermoflexus sp.]
MRERLQKILARAGLGSRRECEELIRQGRVTVNRALAHLGMSADPERDEIRVDGRRIWIPPLTGFALYKPRGVLSDPMPGSGRPSVYDLVPPVKPLYVVGRLDARSEGLVLLINDGDLAHRLTHPRYEHPKVYQVLVEGHPDSETLERWRRGIFLEGQRTRPAKVQVIRYEGGQTWLLVEMREGKKRQIRRIAARLGHPVRRLIRIRIGPVTLGRLRPGQWRPLTPQELRQLRTMKPQAPKALPRLRAG